MWTAQVQFTDAQVEAIHEAAKAANIPMIEFVQGVLADALTKLIKR